MTSTTPNSTDSAGAALEIDTAVATGLLVGFIRDEVRKVGFERVVLGLSGGIDSALTAALACRALGPANVLPVIMPYRTGSPAAMADSELVCADLGMTTITRDITAQIDAYFAADPGANRMRRGNKMARERMTILFDLSFAHEALVLGTTNKTELLLGYGTVFGDMAHALNPLGDLYKTQIFALSRALQLPARVIDKPPSADLWEGQSDEEDLGFSYAEVDALLHHLVDERLRPTELLAMGFRPELIRDVAERIRASQYKRRPPLIAKLTSRTVDREFRYPRDWGR